MSDLYYDIDEHIENNEIEEIMFLLDISSMYLDQDEIYNLLSSVCVRLTYNDCNNKYYEIFNRLYELQNDHNDLNPLLINFLAQEGEFNIFRWIYNKGDIYFNEQEYNECKEYVLKSKKIEFINWFNTHISIRKNETNVNNRLL